ncbi:biotin-dependent carboxyltransferase [Advenella sp. WQ 585]|uniref:Biotin-dependent carboxyltransferase n=1 Tax=Advenella mandrilli TaxID=2800330 RepID=A0ABS1EFB4_9BURK|nr:biotin-dependent carboxyltransferase family protein [Advenella mandrilli]MBK1781913.1 biotin-dependent carboxyltransferase [Advenella mandrilli]
MSIQVINPGLLSTFQDEGRQRFQSIGVPVGGAMNPSSLRLANLLVGNSPSEAVLEITLTGPSLLFEEDACIALSGAPVHAFANNTPIPLNRPFLLHAGQTLHFRQGQFPPMARACLAVHGGFKLSERMGSCSTDLKNRLGGYLGRALQKQDCIQINKPLAPQHRQTLQDFFKQLEIYLPANLGLQKKIGIRVIKGYHWDHFTRQAHERFLDTPFRITPQSERMGYRLQGAALALCTPLQILSEPTVFGSIQVPPDGNPIILMADRQTTGGYPKMANVISADLPVLAQLLPGEHLSFSLVELESAQALMLDREEKFMTLQNQLAIIAQRLSQCYL